jgi:DNA-binding protein YbaB
MADLTVAELQEQQEDLQQAHDKAQASFHDARTRYGKAKDQLVAFNTKYGRMLKTVVVDPEAEADAGEDAETETVEEIADPAGDGPFEDAVDTSAEE